MARTYEHHGVSMQRREIVFDLLSAPVLHALTDVIVEYSISYRYIIYIYVYINSFVIKDRDTCTQQQA